MSARYRLDPSLGRLSAQVFATGMLSFLGHSPTFTALDYVGEVRFPDGLGNGLSLDLTIFAGSITLQDRMKPNDQAEIQSRLHREVLESSAYPEVRFRVSELPTVEVASGHYQIQGAGQLELRGVSRSQAFRAELRVFADGLRLQGSSTLRLSDYRIPPVTALGGSIRLKDEVAISFDLGALPEEEP